MQLHITHETCYDYAPAVDNAQHMAYLKPLNAATQQMLSHSLSITPEPNQHTATLDVYGNTRSFFSLQVAHTQLQVVAHSLVSTQVPPLWDNTVPWEQVRERFRYCAKNRFDAAAEFVFASPYVPRHAEFAAYARPSFAGDTPLQLAARDLMQRIHSDFTYESHSTEVNTPALEALALRKGVCQDFAHIMIACLRAYGLPARYVSGYLRNDDPELHVGRTSHSWAEAWVPGLEWVGFDPANNISPRGDSLRVAVGLDYRDCAPVSGRRVGFGEAKMSVEAAVRVVD